MSFTLTCGSLEVILRNPDSGDLKRVTLNDIRRMTRSGDLDILADNDHWAQINIYIYKFSGLTNIENDPPDPVTDLLIDQLKVFLIVTAGLEITIIDHNTIERDGYILTPINEIISERPLCIYNISFEFLEKPV